MKTLLLNSERKTTIFSTNARRVTTTTDFFKGFLLFVFLMVSMMTFGQTEVRVPDADVNTGTWVNTPLWSKINASGGTLINTPNSNNATNTTGEVTIQNPTNAGLYSGVSIKFDASKNVAGGNARGIDANIRINGTLQTAQTVTTALTSTVVSYTVSWTGLNFTQSDMNSLQVVFTSNGTTGSGSNIRYVEIDYLEATLTYCKESVAPTSISGTTTICNGGSTTLTAVGGTLGTGANYQWGTGAVVGTNPISGQTSSTLTVSPSSSTTYWVRIESTTSPCTANTSGVTQAVTVDATSVGGSVSGTANICSGSTSGLLTLSGHTGSIVRWEYSVSPFSSWTTISNTSTTYTSGALTQTTHFRAVVQSGSCVVANSSAAVITITTTTTTDGGATWDNGSPSNTKAVVYNGSSGIISSDISACTLTLTNNATVTVSSGVDVTLSGAITVNTGSTFTLDNNANLIQSGTTNTNSGNIVVKRNSSALIRLDYTLWSSPVSGQGLYSFSPFTFGNRFYVYRTATNLYNNADVGFSLTGLNGNGVNGTDSNNVPFATAKGYLIRVPWNHPTAAAVWNGTFTGVPNNGDITYTMTSGASGFRFNLVGNPYPSPMSMSQFVLDNSTKITGTLYFWRETNNTTSNNAYCTWAGGTFTTNSEAQAFNPNGIIRTGQGFIVEALASQTALIFNNGQRSSDNANQFFKNNSLANSTNSVETNRFWLNLTNTSGAFSQMAAGYMTDATDGVDIYDGKSINTGDVLLNSVLNNEEYTIQGKSLPFNTADVIPLRYKITNAGDYTITLDHVDGLFTGGTQPIYLKDNLTAAYHDLNTGAYSFTSTPGTFSDRFEIVYTTQLGIENPVFTADNVIIYSQNNQFVVNSGNIIMSSIKVFDIRGRLLESKKEINASQTTIGNGLTNQVLLVQITSEDGITITKKVIR